VRRYSSASPEELVRFCSGSGDPEAWEEFVHRFHRLIAAVVLRTAAQLGDASPQTVDDLIQDTYLKLCADGFRLLRTFDARHSEAIFGYIKVVTANVVRDRFKAFHSQKRGADRLEGIPEDSVFTAGENHPGGAKAIERTVLIRQVERHLENCSIGKDHDRNTRIFWLYYRTGLSAGDIANLLGTGLTTKGVESIIFRLTKDLRARMVASDQASGMEARGAKEDILPA
jgi:RNA polymerase sigma-70 factor (ECF subfamily)